jgi:hypothetical protein
MKTRRRLAALFGAAALTLLISGVAAAHNYTYSLTCEHGLKVSLTYYFTAQDNYVKVDLDGTTVAQEDDFGSTFHYSSGDLDPFVSHTAHIVVDAWDDSDPNDGPPWYSFDVWLNLEACEEPESSEAPLTEPPASEPPASEPPASEPPASFEQSFAAETDTPSEPPASEPPASEPPVSEPPASEPPVTDPPVPSFEQSQEGLTDAPSEPNTATIGGNRSSAPADGAWLLVVALGVLLASIVVLTPAPARRRK